MYLKRSIKLGIHTICVQCEGYHELFSWESQKFSKLSGVPLHLFMTYRWNLVHQIYHLLVSDLQIINHPLPHQRQALAKWWSRAWLTSLVLTILHLMLHDKHVLKMKFRLWILHCFLTYSQMFIRFVGLLLLPTTCPQMNLCHMYIHHM